MIRGGTARFYRAMSLFRQGQAAEAEAKKKPLPAAEQWPLTDDADHNELALWLANKGAKALLAGPRVANP